MAILEYPRSIDWTMHPLSRHNIDLKTNPLPFCINCLHLLTIKHIMIPIKNVKIQIGNTLTLKASTIAKLDVAIGQIDGDFEVVMSILILKNDVNMLMMLGKR